MARVGDVGAEPAGSGLDTFAGLMDLASLPDPPAAGKFVKAAKYVQTVDALAAVITKKGEQPFYDELVVIIDGSGSMNFIPRERLICLLQAIMQMAADLGMKVRLGRFGPTVRGAEPYLDLNEFVRSLKTKAQPFAGGTSWVPQGPQIIDAIKTEGGVHGIIVITDGNLDGGAKDVKKFAEDIASVEAANVVVYVPSAVFTTDSRVHETIQQYFLQVMGCAKNGVLHAVSNWKKVDESADIEALGQFFATRALKASFSDGWVQVGPILIKKDKLPEKDNMVLTFQKLLREQGEAFGNKFKDMCDAFIRTLLSVGSGAAGRNELLGRNRWMGQLNRVLLQFKYYKKAYEDADPELQERRKMEARAAAWEQKNGQKRCFDVDLPVDAATTARKLSNASFAEIRPLLEKLIIFKRPGVPVTAATVQASFALALRRHKVALSDAVAALMMAHVSLYHRFDEGQEEWGTAIRESLSGLAPVLEAAALDVDKLLTAPEHYCHIFQAVQANKTALSPACLSALIALSQLFLARRLTGTRLEYEDPCKSRALPLCKGYAYICRLAADPRDPLKHIQPVVWVFCGVGKDGAAKVVVYFEQKDHLPEDDTWLSKRLAIAKTYGRFLLPPGAQEAINNKPTGKAVVEALLAVKDPAFQEAFCRFRDASCKAWNAMFPTTVQAFLKSKGGEKAALVDFPRPCVGGRVLPDDEMQARFDAVVASLGPALESAEEAIPPGTMITVPPECVRCCAAERFPGVPPALLLPKSEWNAQWPPRGEVQRAWIQGPAACRREYPQVWEVAVPAQPTDEMAGLCRELLAAKIEKAHRVFFVHSAADCPICLETLGDDLAAVTLCEYSPAHKICERCLPLWKDSFADDAVPTCPLCRSPLR